MDYHNTFENGLKYKPDFAWPEADAKRKCPKCKNSLELLENKDNYYGKPWWCAPCQWQFSEEDFESRSKNQPK